MRDILARVRYLRKPLLEAILEALGRCSMHDPANELPRIPLPRTPVNKALVERQAS